MKNPYDSSGRTGGKQRERRLNWKRSRRDNLGQNFNNRYYQGSTNNLKYKFRYNEVTDDE